MITTIPFRAQHLRAIAVQPDQSYMIGHLHDPEFGADIERAGGEAVTVINDGRVICCGGIIPIWEGRGMAWSVIAKGRPSEFIAIHRVAEKMFKASGLRRIEAYVTEGFEQGCRWLEMLGFICETPVPMERFADDRACFMYARIQ